MGPTYTHRIRNSENGVSSVFTGPPGDSDDADSWDVYHKKQHGSKE